MFVTAAKHGRPKRNVPALLSTLFLLAAFGCGGGGGDPPPPSLSGTISAPSGIAIDSDVNDPNETYAANDTLAAAQVIANPVSLGGYANQPNNGAAGRSYAGGDVFDCFRVDLNAGDRIFLAIGDYLSGDLDLFLVRTADGVLIDSSEGTGPSEAITSTAAGSYLVIVGAYSGASNYILTIGPSIDSGRAEQDALSTEYAFVPGQAIVRFADSQIASSTQALSERAGALGMQVAAGAPGREVLLSFEKGAPETELLQTTARKENAPWARAASAELQRKRDTLQVIKALRKRPGVLSAEPNYILHHYAAPNDPYYNLQWHYPLVNLPRAWDVTTGINSVIVAVVDTGVLLNHPDLAGQLIAGYDFISSASISNDGDGIDADPDDPGDDSTAGASSFHGTHCAGTVAAATNNGAGLAGVSWATRIMPIRVLGVGGGTLYDIMQGIKYAARLPNDSKTLPPQAAHIISMSLGGGPFTQTFQDLIDQVRGAGVIVIAAAGNEATSTPSYPASYDGVVSVSAVNINSTRASYSNSGTLVDVAAPGGDSGDLDGDGYADMVWSTCGDDSTGTIQFNYRAMAGTSMATPHVAGVVALMKAVRPTLTPDDLDAMLQAGRLTNDIGAAGRDDYYGYGLIDAYKAVLAALDNTAVTVLKIDPVSLNFGLSGNSATLTASRIGPDTSLAVAGFSQNPASWLSVTAASVDADGFGTYTAAVDRSGLANGTYSAAVTFTDSSAGVVTVPVNLQVNTGAGAANAGFHYVLLLNPTTLASLAQYNVRAVNGTYSYSFAGVAPGDYLIIAGSDRDNDGYIDNAGESVGAYPSLDQIGIVTFNGSRGNLNFATDLRMFLPASAGEGGAAAGLPRFKRLR